MGNQTLFRGPLVNAGALQNSTTQGEVVTPFDGPSVDYQGSVIPDPRQSPINAGAVIPGSVPSFYISPLFVTYEGIPQAIASNALATAQLVTSGTQVTLNTVVATVAATDGAQHLTYGLPIVPQGTSTPVIVSAIDFGFTTGTTVANSSSVVVPDTVDFKVGQWLAIGGVGNTSSNTALFTRVTGVTNRTTITISPVAATARTRATIGNAAFFGQGLTPETNPYVPAVVPSAATGQFVAGFAAVFDARYGAGRNLSISSVTAVGGTGAVTVTGYDVHGNLMTETMTCNGTSTFGLKAFKYVRSILGVGTSLTACSIGIGDTLGFAWRLDNPALALLGSDNATAQTATSARGFTAAIVGPSTATTGDVRGTVQLNTGTLATSKFAVSINGSNKYTLAQFVTPDQVINATPLGYTSLFGVAQA